MEWDHYDAETKAHYRLKTDLAPWVWYVVKFLIYGGLGMTMEIVFTDLVRILSYLPGVGSLVGSFSSMVFPQSIPDQMLFDPRYLFAMSSVWMVLVYGTGYLVIQHLYRLMNPADHKKNPLLKKGWGSRLFRALCYALAIVLVEFAWGWILHFVMVLTFQVWPYLLPAGTQLPNAQDLFIWQYRSLLKTTTLAVLPFWLLAGMAGEVIVKKLSEKDLMRAFLTNHDDLREQKKNHLEGSGVKAPPVS